MFFFFDVEVDFSYERHKSFESRGMREVMLECFVKFGIERLLQDVDFLSVGIIWHFGGD